MAKFNVGYLFKPTHDEIHFLKIGANGDMRKKYSNNFTTNIELAEVGKNEEKAKNFIVKLVSKFPDDDDYKWTPVIVDIDNKTYKRFTHGQWHNEAIKISFHAN